LRLMIKIPSHRRCFASASRLSRFDFAVGAE
jgi:hypothetical protein